MTGDSLTGNTVILTRPECRSAELANRLEELGAKVLAVPSIRFSPLEDSAPWQLALENRDGFSHLIFSSITAVDTFASLCSRAGITLDSWLPNCTVCASGAATAAALEGYGFTEIMVSSGSTGSDFAPEFIEKEKPGPETRILLPGSEIARGELAAGLRRCGAQVEEVAIYRTCTEEPARAAPLLEALERGETPQAITFASPSAVKGFLDLCGEQGLGLLEDSSVKIISIGPTTSEDIRARGLEVSAQAARPTTESIIDALAGALGE